MAVYPFSLVNRRGIAKVTSTAVTVGADNVVFAFPNGAFYNVAYEGIVLVELAQAIPADTTGTLPVLFSSNGTTQAVTTVGGAALTAAGITGAGVYQFYFDKRRELLQQI